MLKYRLQKTSPISRIDLCALHALLLYKAPMPHVFFFLHIHRQRFAFKAYQMTTVPSPLLANALGKVSGRHSGNAAILEVVSPSVLFLLGAQPFRFVCLVSILFST